MLIYSHNLAEKLFGFAQSREFLKYNTDLCGALEDPNLQTDIDLAIDLHKADRGDDDAARRLTNMLVLCSAFIDMSTKNFYTFKMSTRPIFARHIARINLTFSAISLEKTSILNNIKSSGDDEDGFLDKLLDALKDCLNSPCNNFAKSSDSVAALAKVANTQNINAIPSFSELADQFTHTFEGIDQTLFKKLPKSIKSNAIKMGQLCQKSWSESMSMFFEKDKEAKKKIIEKAQSGEALDLDDAGFRYVPDLDNYLNTNKMASNILAKAASDLGGCFNNYQQAYRYDPYSADYNLAVTSKRPTKNKVNDTEYDQNLLGQAETNGERNLNADSIIGAGIPAGASPEEVQKYIKQALKGSSLIGYVPDDGSKYGITTGSEAEWTNFFTVLAKAESGYNSASRNDSDPGGSLGLFQISTLDGSRYGANPTGKNWTEAEAFEPRNNTQTAVKIFEQNVPKTGNITSSSSGKGAGGYFAATSMIKVSRALGN